VRVTSSVASRSSREPLQYGESQRAFGYAGAAPSAPGALCLGQDRQPVFDRLTGKGGPGPIWFGERACVRFQPQRQQLVVVLRREPCPRGTDRRSETWARSLSSLLEQGHLLFPRPGEQRPDELLLGAEQEEQYPGA